MGSVVHMIFMLLLVGTLVTGFQVLGTLMVVGIMMLPATSARFWVQAAGRQMVLAAAIVTSTWDSSRPPYSRTRVSVNCLSDAFAPTKADPREFRLLVIGDSVA